MPTTPPTLQAAAADALRRAGVHDIALLAPVVAARLAERGGVAVLLDASGRVRFGRHGRLLDASDAVAELRDEARRDGDRLTLHALTPR